MVEKMGHKKRMQVMRMEWINEGKPKLNDELLFEEPSLPPHEQREKTAPRVAPIIETRTSERPKTPIPNADFDAEMEDLYDATPRAARNAASNVQQNAASAGGSIFGPKTVNVDGPPGDDELDALLVEEETLQATSGNIRPAVAVSKNQTAQDEIDEDELAAMEEMEGMW